MPNATEKEPLLQIEIPGLKKVAEGKVRAMFDLDGELLVVTTDRISAFDVVFPNGIPGKGRILNQLSAFWFETLGTEHHMISTDMKKMPKEVREMGEVLDGRVMRVRRAEPLPVECVARGYLFGSAWKEYRANGRVCGIRLAPGLRMTERLDRPVFTPSTKAKEGHDENISFERVVREVGRKAAEALRDRTLDLYRRAHEFALARGIVIADTKFEFGEWKGKLLLIDEALTPDSSRFWPAGEVRPGESPPSFDKQFVRDFVESIGWNKKPPAPELPPEVVGKTAEKYREAFRLLTGREPRGE